MNLILFVLNDPDKLEDVIDAWEEAGVSGITLLSSHGLERVRYEHGYRDDFPLIVTLQALNERDETHNHTMFSAVDDDQVVARVVKVTQEIVGDLNKPHTGILLVLPVLQSYGLHRES
ncbi:MAG: hypothetical protein ACOYYS_21640 [Chloroflexota bacterium]